MYSQMGDDEHLMEIERSNPGMNKTDKLITSLLSKLQEPWVCDKTEKIMEGFLHKRQRKTPHTWRLYKFILSGNNLYYYSSDKSKKPRGIISVSYISNKVPLTEAHIFELKRTDVSSHFLYVFSPNRLDMLCGVSNEELDLWHNSLTGVLHDSLGREVVDSREKALNELMPMLSEKSTQDIEKILGLLADLESRGFGNGKQKREKSGTLEMLVEDENGESSWVRFYFVLQCACLYYFKSSKSQPKGIITLKFTTIVKETRPEMQHCLRLTTPLSTFILRAKHEVALDEWIAAICNSKVGKKTTTRREGEKAGLISAEEFSDLDKMSELDLNEAYRAWFYRKTIPQLSYNAPDGKHKVYKLMLGSNLIGRSETSNLKIDDKKVSRSHCKIEVTEHNAFVLDLGSGHGTKVNGHRADKQILAPGDEIKVGKTKLLFDVVASKK